MEEKDIHEQETQEELDNLTRLKDLLDEWKMYYLERAEPEKGAVLELPIRTESEHHFRMRILLSADQNICSIRVMFSFYVRKEDRYLMAQRLAQINADIHDTPAGGQGSGHKKKDVGHHHQRVQNLKDVA